MKRDIYARLLAWKKDDLRKPLLLKGARQTGKTFLLKQFGNTEYSRLHYFNFEKTPMIRNLFSENLEPSRIIESLSLYSRAIINPSTDLIVFDEIQVCNGALTSLKYFQEEKPEYHIAAAGSLLGIKLSIPGSFPVGKVNLIELHPMSFFEFLEAIGEKGFRSHIEQKPSIRPFDEPIHLELIRLLKMYYYIGGMPEAVQRWIDTKDMSQVSQVHEEILATNELDFAKHAPVQDIPRLSEVWNSISVHLARENKKFVFSAVRDGARARAYDFALQWLADTGLICRAFATSHVELPLVGFISKETFKVYSLDTGLLAAMAGIDSAILANGNELFQTYNGAFVENYAAQQLRTCTSAGDLTYWRSDGRKAEVDFICQIDRSIYPLEIKAGINPRSKSLLSYREKYSPRMCIRSTLLNLKLDSGLMNLPLYALGDLERYVRLGMKT
jgi:uncharacterized protein